MAHPRKHIDLADDLLQRVAAVHEDAQYPACSVVPGVALLSHTILTDSGAKNPHPLHRDLPVLERVVHAVVVHSCIATRIVDSFLQRSLNHPKANRLSVKVVEQDRPATVSTSTQLIDDSTCSDKLVARPVNDDVEAVILEAVLLLPGLCFKTQARPCRPQPLNRLNCCPGPDFCPLMRARLESLTTRKTPCRPHIELCWA